MNSGHKIHNDLKKREERDHLTSVVTVGRKDTLKRSVGESMGNLTRRKAQSPFLYQKTDFSQTICSLIAELLIISQGTPPS